MVGARDKLVQLQPVRGEVGFRGTDSAGPVACVTGTVSALLQPICEPRTVGQAGQGFVSKDGEEDDQSPVAVASLVDRGAVPGHGIADPAAVPADVEMDVRFCLLPGAEQPDGDL